jgi:hypothetical protein
MPLQISVHRRNKEIRERKKKKRDERYIKKVRMGKNEGMRIYEREIKRWEDRERREMNIE